MVCTFLVALSGLIIAIAGAAWLHAVDRPQGSGGRAFQTPLDD